MVDEKSTALKTEASSREPIGKFLDDLSKALSPHLQECFSDDTKKLRSAVLSVAIILILLALGTVEIANEGSFAGIKFESKSNGVLQTSGAIVELFLLIVFAIRCYVEWTVWKLKNLSPEWALMTLHTELTEAQMQRLANEEQLRNELVALVMKSQYGAKTNQLSQVLTESSQGELAQQQRSMSTLIDKYLSKVQLARQARFWLETFFPLLFGAFAVAAALR